MRGPEPVGAGPPRGVGPFAFNVVPCGPDAGRLRTVVFWRLFSFVGVALLWFVEAFFFVASALPSISAGGVLPLLPGPSFVFLRFVGGGHDGAAHDCLFGRAVVLALHSIRVLLRPFVELSPATFFSPGVGILAFVPLTTVPPFLSGGIAGRLGLLLG